MESFAHQCQVCKLHANYTLVGLPVCQQECAKKLWKKIQNNSTITAGTPIHNTDGDYSNNIDSVNNSSDSVATQQLIGDGEISYEKKKDKAHIRFIVVEMESDRSVTELLPFTPAQKKQLQKFDQQLQKFEQDIKQYLQKYAVQLHAPHARYSLVYMNGSLLKENKNLPFSTDNVKYYRIPVDFIWFGAEFMQRVQGYGDTVNLGFTITGTQSLAGSDVKRSEKFASIYGFGVSSAPLHYPNLDRMKSVQQLLQQLPVQKKEWIWILRLFSDKNITFYPIDYVQLDAFPWNENLIDSDVKSWSEREWIEKRMLLHFGLKSTKQVAPIALWLRNSCNSDDRKLTELLNFPTDHLKKYFSIVHKKTQDAYTPVADHPQKPAGLLSMCDFSFYLLTLLWTNPDIFNRPTNSTNAAASPPISSGSYYHIDVQKPGFLFLHCQGWKMPTGTTTTTTTTTTTIKPGQRATPTPVLQIKLSPSSWSLLLLGPSGTPQLPTNRAIRLSATLDTLQKLVRWVDGNYKGTTGWSDFYTAFQSYPFVSTTYLDELQQSIKNFKNNNISQQITSLWNAYVYAIFWNQPAILAGSGITDLDELYKNIVKFQEFGINFNTRDRSFQLSTLEYMTKYIKFHDCAIPIVQGGMNSGDKIGPLLQLLPSPNVLEKEWNYAKQPSYDQIEHSGKIASNPCWLTFRVALQLWQDIFFIPSYLTENALGRLLYNFSSKAFPPFIPASSLPTSASDGNIGKGNNNNLSHSEKIATVEKAFMAWIMLGRDAICATAKKGISIFIAPTSPLVTEYLSPPTTSASTAAYTSAVFPWNPAVQGIFAATRGLYPWIISFSQTPSSDRMELIMHYRIDGQLFVEEKYREKAFQKQGVFDPMAPIQVVATTICKRNSSIYAATPKQL
jgi:hypothetical protein